MKRILKIFGLLLAVLAVIAGIGATYISVKGIPTYPTGIPEQLVDLKVKPDSMKVARGAAIAAIQCIACHTGADNKLSGSIMSEVPKEFGTLASYNITSDPQVGIGSWTDGELYYFLRTGIRKDGSWAPPMMPKFQHMADEDVYSVIAWLRSNDPRLQADSREFPPNKYNFLMKFLCNTVFKAPALPAQPITIPDSANRVVFGEYVANDLATCFPCHSADFKTINMDNPPLSEGFYGGGNPMLNREGNLVPSANITMDKETGIGSWTEEQFVEAVRFGKNPKGGALSWPMFPHTTLTDNEVRAIWAYLQTVPPIVNKVERYTEM